MTEEEVPLEKTAKNDIIDLCEKELFVNSRPDR